MAVDIQFKQPIVRIGDSLTQKKSILLSPISTFFSNTENLAKMLPVLHGKARISLRLLDWFVTNYSKKFNVVYTLNGTGTSDNFVVYSSYKSQLKAFSKVSFDPFCRRERIDFYYTLNNIERKIVTTIAQLNFFKWAIENKVIDYVIQYLDEIEYDMKESTETAKMQIKSGTRKKRTELSVSATKSVTKQTVSVIVSFD